MVMAMAATSGQPPWLKDPSVHPLSPSNQERSSASLRVNNLFHHQPTKPTTITASLPNRRCRLAASLVKFRRKTMGFEPISGTH
ncbi:hypothetical protein P3S67_001762 [Capsicum chacoense]